MNKLNSGLLIGFSLWATLSCKTLDESVDPIHAGLADWTTASHSNDAKPDYDIVFPQDKVNSIEITLTSENWEAIKMDMISKVGNDFGAGGNMNGGNGPFPGNIGQPPFGENTGNPPMNGGNWQNPDNNGQPPFGGNMGNPPINGGNPNNNGQTPPNIGGNPNNGQNPPNGNGGALDIIPGDPIYVPVSFKFNGKEWYKVGFRLKGNSSLSQAWSQGIYKLPFRLQFDEFEDEYPEIKNQRFYGFKELSMAPGHNDNSLMRDKIVADLFRSAGIPAARTSFCKVYINFGDGLKYCGVYTMIEVIDDTMVENQFGEDKGNIYKPESTFQTFNQANFEKKNNKTAADYSDVQAVITALNSTERTSNPSQWRTNLEKVFNVDHFLKYLAINNTIVNWDSYGAMAHNYYLYTPTATKKVTWIPWDFNLAMTSTSTNGNQQGSAMGAMGRGVSLEMTEVGSNWPLIRYLADDAIYLAKYKNFVQDFTSKYFTSDKMNAIIDKHYNLISPFVIGNEPEQTKYSFLSNAGAFSTGVEELKQHVRNRNQAVNAYLK